MRSPLRDALLTHASLSILGMCKNAGKTTVLNRLIALSKNTLRRPLALTSIGRDGEAVDIVTGTEKPGIWAPEGTLVATAADMLRHCDTTREILHTSGVCTPLGEVVVFRALSDGFVQLAGPSTREQMAALTQTLRFLGANLVLIDGAISRKSLGAPSVAEAAILCTGASYHPDMDTVIRDTAYACTLLTLPVARGERAGRHVLAGAATDAALARLAPGPGEEVTLLDPSRALLSRPVFERLRSRGVSFSVLNAAKLCCVCVNPVSAAGLSFDAALFQKKMAAAVPVSVLNVREDADDRPSV